MPRSKRKPADFMVDLETLGTSPGSVVVSIGVAMFSTEEGVTDTLEMVVDPEDAQAHGLRIEAGTVMWWMGQSAEARQALKGGKPLKPVLQELTQWLQEKAAGAPISIWGNGASFDPPLLEACYRAAGLPIPWKYWDVRCYRTIQELTGAKPRRVGTHHRALDDAITQAEVIVRVMQTRAKAVGGGGQGGGA